MKILDLRPDATDIVRQVASLLVEGFREHWPNAWPTLASALAEVHESFAKDRMASSLPAVVVAWESSSSAWSFGPQRHDGIDARRPSRRQVARRQSDEHH